MAGAQDDPRPARRQIDLKVLGVVAGAGLVCLLAAVTGGTVKGLGFELSGVKAGPARITLGVLGGLLLLAGVGVWWWQDRRPAPAPPLEPPESAGGLPVPVRRPRLTPRFTGRKELLAEVRKRLRGGRPVVLVGMGGVGKTQLALAYLARYGQGYQLIGWLRAEQPPTLATDYAALAVELELPERDESEQARVVAAVRGWLAEHTGWLLVFDNAETVAPYLPDRPGGHVLVTSRNPGWRDEVTVPVMPWSREESLEFLAHASAGDEPAADALAEVLGDLPLALEQALAYLDETHSSMEEYRELLAEQAKELFRRGRPSSYQETVATTWSLSMPQARERAPGAEDLLTLCAFLAADDIPRGLLAGHAEALPEPLSRIAADRVAFNDATAALARYSLVTAAPGTLGVHRLVQLVVRQDLDPGEEGWWAGVAARLLRASFPEDSGDVRTWPTCARLLPHALAAGGHGERLAVEPEAAGWLLDRAATYLQGRALFGDAKALFERALAIGEADGQGPDHPTVGTARNNLGGVLQALGDLTGARAQLEQALAITEAALGPDHPTVGTDRNNLGGVLQALGNLTGARAQYEQALAVDEAALGPTHPTVGTDRNNLGGVLQDLGDLTGARAQYEQALAIAEAALGPTHPDVGAARNNLGGVLRDLGDLTGARAQLEQALAIAEAALGPDHPTVGAARNNLGSVLRDLGDLTGARAQLEQALAIAEAALGPDHPTVGAARNNLGSVLQDLGDLTGARAQLEQALAIAEAALGPDHPDVATRRGNLGSVLQALGDLTGARAQYEQALAIAEAALGPTHPDVGAARNNLGGVLRDLGDLTGARAQLEQALAIAEAALGPDHPTVGAARNNLGSVLRDLGDLTGARAQLEQALAIAEAALGPTHPTVGLRRNNLGSVLQALGDLTGARAQYEQALAITEAALGPTHPTVATQRNNLQGVLHDLGSEEPRADT